MLARTRRIVLGVALHRPQGPPCPRTDDMYDVPVFAVASVVVSSVASSRDKDAAGPVAHTTNTSTHVKALVTSAHVKAQRAHLSPPTGCMVVLHDQIHDVGFAAKQLEEARAEHDAQAPPVPDGTARCTVARTRRHVAAADLRFRFRRGHRGWCPGPRCGGDVRRRREPLCRVERRGGGRGVVGGRGPAPGAPWPHVAMDLLWI